MVNQSAAYRSILKATTILGSVRVVTVLINLVKNKLIAVLMGTSGLGFLGIYVSAIGLITSVADLGLSKSSVRSISWAKGKGDEVHVSRIVSVFGRMLWWTAGTSAVVTVIFSKQLSILVFGDDTSAWSFALLSLAVLFQTVSIGHLAILQGLRELKLLALASSIGASIGLILSIPFFFFMGPSGIVPSIVVSCLTAMVVSTYLLRRVHLKDFKLSNGQVLKEGKEMLLLGVSMMAVSVMVALSGFAIRAYITSNGGVTAVGVFHAGYTIITGYFGMITTAMVTDYFPRISAISLDNDEISKEVNSQCNMTLLLLTPLAILLIIIGRHLVSLLFSSDFQEAAFYVKWAVFGVILQPVGQSLGMILLAKNDSLTFVSSVLLLQVLFLLSSVVFFDHFGITGLGFVYSINMFINVCVMYFLLRLRYGIRLKRITIFNTGLSIVALCITFLVMSVNDSTLKIVGSLTILSISTCYCLYRILKIMEISSISLKRYVSKLRKYF